MSAQERFSSLSVHTVKKSLKFKFVVFGIIALLSLSVIIALALYKEPLYRKEFSLYINLERNYEKKERLILTDIRIADFFTKQGINMIFMLKGDVFYYNRSKKIVVHSLNLNSISLLIVITKELNSSSYGELLDKKVLSGKMLCSFYYNKTKIGDYSSGLLVRIENLISEVEHLQNQTSEGPIQPVVPPINFPGKDTGWWIGPYSVFSFTPEKKEIILDFLSITLQLISKGELLLRLSFKIVL